MDLFFGAPRFGTEEDGCISIRATPPRQNFFFKSLAFGLLGPATGSVELSAETLESLRSLGLDTEGFGVTTLARLAPLDSTPRNWVLTWVREDLLRSIVVDPLLAE